MQTRFRNVWPSLPHPSVMRHVVIALLLVSGVASPAAAQRRARAERAAVPPSREAIDEFVVTVRDMAAWALVTPAAHIPVGGIEDSSGYVATVVGPPKDPSASPDSVLALFRRTLGVGARRARARTIGLAYLVLQVPPQGTSAIEVVAVEVEHRSGFRANVYFPYIRDEERRPVFSEPFSLPGTLRVIGARP